LLRGTANEEDKDGRSLEKRGLNLYKLLSATRDQSKLECSFLDSLLVWANICDKIGLLFDDPLDG